MHGPSLRIAVFCALFSLAAAALPASRGAAASDPTPRVDLAGAQWTRNGVLPESPPVQLAADGEVPAHVALPMGERPLRWALRFTTAQAATHRLWLDWAGGPDGLVFEVMLDGEPLRPARDAWRPTLRGLRSDLGPRWLGQGEHLLEFIARETSPGAALRLSALELLPP